MNSKKVLIIFGAAILVLVIIATGLALLRGNMNSALLPENTPDGVVQRVLIALKNKDVETVKQYIIIPDNQKPLPPDYWQNTIITQPETDWKATLTGTTITGANALVDVAVDVFRPSGPFGDPVHTNRVTFNLVNQNGKWMITSPTSFYFFY